MQELNDRLNGFLSNLSIPPLLCPVVDNTQNPLKTAGKSLLVTGVLRGSYVETGVMAFGLYSAIEKNVLCTVVAHIDNWSTVTA